MKSSRLKKTIGISLFIVMGALQLLFLLALVAVLVMDTEPDTGQGAIGYVFALGMFTFPLLYGLRLWKVNSVKPLIPSDDKRVVRIQTRINFSDYRNLVLRMTYSKPMVLYVHFIGLTLMIAAFMTPGYDSAGTVIAVMLLGTPLAIVLQAKGNFKSTNILKEMVTYEFTSTGIAVQGETFNSAIEWPSIYKVKEWENWFLFYMAENTAYIVPKQAFPSEEEIKIVRAFCRVE